MAILPNEKAKIEALSLSEIRENLRIVDKERTKQGYAIDAKKAANPDKEKLFDRILSISSQGQHDALKEEVDKKGPGYQKIVYDFWSVANDYKHANELYSYMDKRRQMLEKREKLRQTVIGYVIIGAVATVVVGIALHQFGKGYNRDPFSTNGYSSSLNRSASR